MAGTRNTNVVAGRVSLAPTPIGSERTSPASAISRASPAEVIVGDASPGASQTSIVGQSTRQW